MFKRRKFSRFGSKRKLLTRASANRTFKHAVREKVISINVKCQEICTTPGATCPNGGKHILVSNAELFSPTATGFADAVRITRIEGTLWVKPDYTVLASSASTCAEAVSVLNHATIFRMGLLKSPTHQATGGVPVAVNPLADGPSPFALSDAADSRFLKTWDHLFQPQFEVLCGTNTFPMGGWRAPGYSVPALDGTSPGATHQDGYVVPPDNCEICETQGAGTTFSETLKYPGWHALRVSYRRAIVVKENEALDLWYAWEAMKNCADDARVVQPPLQWVGHVFLTVEH